MNGPWITAFRSRGLEFERRTSCPACGHRQSAALFTLPYSDPKLCEYLTDFYRGRAQIERLRGMVYQIASCGRCGLLFQTDVPGACLLGDVYDLWIPPGEREALSARRDARFHRDLMYQVDSMLRHIRRPPHQVKVLDFGLGWAEWASMARACGCDVFGCELSSERIAYARSVGIAMLDSRDLPGSNFDFINTEQVFEHLVEPLQTLRHLASALAPGGIVKVSVPDARGSIAELRRGRFPMSLAPLEHVNGFTARSLAELGRAAGLVQVRPRLIDLLNAASGWLDPRQACRNIARPIYRHVFPKSTHQFFTAAAPCAE